MQNAGCEFAEFSGLFRRGVPCGAGERERVFALSLQIWADSQHEQTSALCNRYELSLTDSESIVCDGRHKFLSAQYRDGFDMR